MDQDHLAAVPERGVEVRGAAGTMRPRFGSTGAPRPLTSSSGARSGALAVEPPEQAVRRVELLGRSGRSPPSPRRRRRPARPSHSPALGEEQSEPRQVGAGRLHAEERLRRVPARVGRHRVSRIPSGAKSRSWAKRAVRCPVASTHHPVEGLDGRVVVGPHRPGPVLLVQADGVRRAVLGLDQAGVVAGRATSSRPLSLLSRLRTVTSAAAVPCHSGM